MSLILIFSSCGQQVGLSDPTAAAPAPATGTPQPTIPLTVTIEQNFDQADPAYNYPIIFRATFSREVDPDSFKPFDLVQTGTASNIVWDVIPLGNGRSFLVKALSGVDPGTVTPVISARTVLSTDGTFNELSTSLDNNVTYLNPVDVTIEQKVAQADPTISLPIEFDIIFSESIDISTFETSDITQEGTASGIIWNLINSGDDTNFTLQATNVAGEGTLIPSLKASSIQTPAGHNNNSSSSIDNSVTYSQNFDVNINQKGAQADPTASLPIEFDVVFGAAIDAATFTVADIAQNGTAIGITWNITNSGDNINFTLQAIAITGGGTVIPSLADSLVQTSSALNNNASTSSDSNVTYATTFDVTVNQKGTQADPTASLPIEFDIVFSEAIDDATFTVGDITQNGTATGITWNIINSGDDINFTLQAIAATGDGTIVPTLAASTIQDGEVMNNTASTSTDNSVTLDTSIVITNIVEPVNSSYGAGAELFFQVIYAEVIDVTGTPRIPIDVGGVTRYANYSQGTGTTGIEFKYTVSAGENDADGISLQSGSIDQNGGTMIGAVTSGAARLDLSSSIDSLVNVLVDTSQLPPDQVTGVTTAPTTSSSEMGVSWNVPANNGTPITHYSVQYREQGTSTWLNKFPTPTSNSTVITGLTAGITYEIRAAANNGVLGPYSAIATAEIFDVMSLDPIAWIDAANVNGDGSTPTNGSKVATWVDLTGAATNATEADPAKQPVYTYSVQNGLPAVRFDDLDRGLAGGFTRNTGTDLTIVIVGQFDNGYSDKCMFEFRDVATGNNRAFFIDRRYAGNTTYSPALTKGNFQMWTITNSGTYSTVSEDGVTQLYAGNNDFNTDFTGNGEYFLGDDATGGNRMYGYIGEILIFDKNLSGAEIAQLEDYLKAKWGI